MYTVPDMRMRGVYKALFGRVQEMAQGAFLLASSSATHPLTPDPPQRRRACAASACTTTAATRAMTYCNSLINGILQQFDQWNIATL